MNLMESDQSEVIQFARQAIGVRSDSQHPLFERHTNDRMSAAFALAVDDLFVRQHRAEGRTPVDGSIGYIGKAMLVLVAADGLRQRFVSFERFSVSGATPQLARISSGIGSSLNRATFAFAFNAIRTGPDMIGVVPRVEDLQEDPLRPAVVIRIGRRPVRESSRN